MIKKISYYKIYKMSNNPTYFHTPSPTVQDYHSDGDFINLLICLFIFTVAFCSCFRASARYYYGRNNLRRIYIQSGIVYDVELAQYDYSICMNNKNFPVEQESCIICYEDYSKEDNIKELKNCKHIFHKDCINTWLNVNEICPICRNKVYLNSS